jgi:hypothetical protein
VAAVETMLVSVIVVCKASAKANPHGIIPGGGGEHTEAVVSSVGVVVDRTVVVDVGTPDKKALQAEVKRDWS